MKLTILTKKQRNELASKKRSPIKPSKKHKDKTKYSRKIKFRTPVA